MPLAPEKKIPLTKDLNIGQQEYNDGKSPKNKKLIADCKDKKEYVIHERLLLYYIKLGLKIKKIHRIISFREENWLEPYIDLNTDLRTKSKTEFEKNIWKLMNNAFYGKTCENIRNRTDVKFVTSEKQAIKLHTNPFYKGETIFIDDKLIAIQMGIKKVIFDKPIYIGMSVLDLSKLLMYKTFYDIILKQWPTAEIIGFDTDSFFLYIEVDDVNNSLPKHSFDVYKDMIKMKNKNIFDTIDYPNFETLEGNVERVKKQNEKDMKIFEGIEMSTTVENNIENENNNALEKVEKELKYWKNIKENPNDKRNSILKVYNTGKHNKKVIGKFKDELSGKIMTEICFMRSKQYSYLTEGEFKATTKCKGITKAVIKNKIKFN